MAQIASEVFVAGKGGLYKAPLGTAKPADSTVVLDAAYKNLGYFSSDGVGISFEDSVQNIFAWQGAALVRTVRTETLTKLTFKPIQTRGSVLEAFHPGSQITEPTTGNWEMDIIPAEADPATWVFDAFDGTKRMRYYIANGEITERGELMHVNGEALGYPMTMTFYPSDTGSVGTVQSNIAAVGIDIV